MQSRARTVTEYLKSLPGDRRKAVSAVRAVVRKNIARGFKESMGWGMIVWTVPLKDYPDTYNGQPLCFGGLASQKQYISLYLMPMYGKEETWLREEFRKAGKTLKSGKSCIRFRRVEDLPLDVIANIVASYTPATFIQRYEEMRTSQYGSSVTCKKR